MNYNVYGQTTQLITGTGQGPLTVTCPVIGPISIFSQISFTASGTSEGIVTSGNLQINSNVGVVNGDIFGGYCRPINKSI